MTGESDRLEALRELLEALFEGRITPEQEARLEAMVLTDPEAEKFYITYTNVHSDLVYRGVLRPDGAIPTPPSGEGTVGGDLKAVRSGPARGRKLRWPWISWTLAAAASVVAMTSVWRWPIPTMPRRATPPMIARDREKATGAVRHAVEGGELLATVIRLSAARWEPADGPPPAEGNLLSTGRLRLNSGLATLAFLNGVTLILEGPADVDLVSIDRVFCRRGRLRAHVPEGAEGFVVTSPNSAVIDLGTEFALNVGDDGKSQVMVFEGMAEAALLDEGGSSQRARLVKRGKAFDLDPGTGHIAEAVARPEGFVLAPDFAVPDLVLDPSYSDVVMRSRPRGYWRFERATGGTTPSEMPGGPALRINGPVAFDGPTGKGCAVFRAGAPEQFLAAESTKEPSREVGQAFEVWFMAEGYSYASLMGLLPTTGVVAGQESLYVHTTLVELTTRDLRRLHKPASVRLLHRWPLDVTVQYNAYSAGIYVPRRWHHVVAQKQGDRMGIYLDGVPGDHLVLDPDYPTLPCSLVVGRRTTDPLDPQDSRSFVGRLDELAIYDHPLSAEEVRRHFKLATSNARPR